jgi:hypothetical protein
MLPLWITCIVVLPVLALVFYVVRRTKPGRFRLSAKVLKLLDISIEIDGHDKPDELPGNQPGAGGILRAEDDPGAGSPARHGSWHRQERTVHGRAASL